VMGSLEQLNLIRDARGDAALLALTTVDLTFPELSGDERAALRSDLEVAAVPHWCDAALLADLLDARGPQTGRQWTRLRALAVVESFPARGVDAGNVHEASRLALRKRLAETQPARFLELTVVPGAHVFSRPMGDRSVGLNGFITFLRQTLSEGPSR
jgi:hypothetical protein